MSSEAVSQVLRCELCSKPFNKEATLKRHRYYCRSRKGAERTVRSRSCVPCAKSKTRCDNATPTCGRCAGKDLCCYVLGRTPSITASLEAETRVEEVERTLIGTSDSSSLPNGISPRDNSEVANNEDSLNFPSISNAEDQLEWSLIHDGRLMTPSFDLADTHSTTTFIEDSLSLVYGNVESAEGTYTSSTFDPILNSSLSSKLGNGLRSFIQRPAIQGGALTTSMLMVRILVSYPMMLRDTNSPPPFIHPFSLSGDENTSTESLTTCANLMQMVGNGGHGSRNLLWKNVRLECERLQVQWPELDAWELLSSMQALLIYMLLRLQEGETVQNNFDALLLSTMWVVGCAMNCKIGNFNCNSPHGLSYGTTYKEWIFEESRRRMALTFRIIGLLFSTEPAGTCVLNDGFLLAPLPAKKQLWEAGHELQWMMAKSRDVGGENVFGMKADGRMAKMNVYPTLSDGSDELTARNLSESASSANWSEWCAGMDGLGALVMLAASLPTHI